MAFAQPHYLLFCDAHPWDSAASDAGPAGGRWHFVLERIDIAERFEATDGERAQPQDRLALWSVVRGLEAIEQPSQVTLVTTSRYVSRGLRYGLSEWREVNYCWEHFGVQKPIRNSDLWQRIDSALQYHQVTCRLLESSLARVDAPHAVHQSLDELELAGLLPNELTDATTLKMPAREVMPEEALPEQLSPECDEANQRDGRGIIPRPHFRPAPRGARRAASVRHKPRPGSEPEVVSWKQLAGGLLGWCRGRAGLKAATSGGSSLIAGM